MATRKTVLVRGDIEKFLSKEIGEIQNGVYGGRIRKGLDGGVERVRQN